MSTMEKVRASFEKHHLPLMCRSFMCRDPEAIWELTIGWFRHRGWFEPSNETMICRALCIIEQMQKSVDEMKTFRPALNSLEYIKKEAEFLLKHGKLFGLKQTPDECFKIKYLEARTRDEKMEKDIERGEKYISILRLIMVEYGHKVETEVKTEVEVGQAGSLNA
jgi:hypothetical protein